MKQKWLGLAAILIGMSASALMQTMIAATMPTITADIGGLSLYSWVFSGYMLASTVTIPLFGRLADLFGRRILYVTGLLVFLLGAALVGAAQRMDLLVAYRIVQGIGAGAVAPAALAAIGDLFGDKERGKVFGFIGAAQVIANLIGPPLGGWIADAYSWRLNFWLVLPVGGLAALLALVSLPNQRWQPAPAVAAQPAGRRRQALESAPDERPAEVLAAEIPSAPNSCSGSRPLRRTLAAFSAPRLAAPAFWQPAAGAFLLGLATASAVAYFPLYLQQLFAFTAAATGLALLPMLLMAGVASAAGGWLTARAPRPTQAAAWALIASGFCLLALLRPQNIGPLAALIGAGMGLLLPVYLHTAQEAGGEAFRATASGLIQMARNLGGALGIPLLGVWLAGGEPKPAFSALFASLALVGVCGLILGAVAPGARSAPHSSAGAGDAVRLENSLPH